MNYLFAAETLSNFLAVPVLVACVYVLVIWYPAFREIVVRRTKRRTSRDLFIAGVFVAFMGEALDNLYWTLAWASQYARGPARDWLFNHGVVANIPFRQTACLVAGYLHVLSALRYEQRGHHAWRWLAASACAGALFTLALWWVR